MKIGSAGNQTAIWGGLASGAVYVIWPDKIWIAVSILSLSGLAFAFTWSYWVLANFGGSKLNSAWLIALGILLVGVGGASIFFGIKARLYRDVLLTAKDQSASTLNVIAPNISFQKFALFWVEIDKNTYQLGVITKLFNLDTKPYLINGMVFDRTSWSLIPRGVYHLQRYVENGDHAELIEDNFIKPSSEGYFKKLLPIKIDLTIDAGSTPEFMLWGAWKLMVGKTMVQLEPPFYSVYEAPISQQEWGDLLKPKSKIDINNFQYKELGLPPRH